MANEPNGVRLIGLMGLMALGCWADRANEPNSVGLIRLMGQIE